MAIICDNCNVDITPTDKDGDTWERHVLQLNGKRICLCTDCFIVLSEFACSDSHKKLTEQYGKMHKEHEEDVFDYEQK
jgi:hypothetical protein